MPRNAAKPCTTPAVGHQAAFLRNSNLTVAGSCSPLRCLRAYYFLPHFPVKFFSTFSGIGGFEIPLLEANHECVGYSEIDPYAIQVYASHFPSHYNHGNITRIEPSALPDFDLLCGGFPCQSFSIAGDRRGFEDVRGTLFFDLCRIIAAKRPRLLLFENVRGLLNHDDGRTFGTILASLDELGYDLQWQVCNSTHYGVPQSRERVFIVGHRRGTSRPEVFPLAGFTKPALSSRVTGVAIRGRNNRPTLEIRTDGIANALRTASGGSSKPMVIVEGRVRRMTPVECERVQGFPDKWTSGLSDAQRYKCLGNAVTVNVIRRLIERLCPPEASPVVSQADEKRFITTNSSNPRAVWSASQKRRICSSAVSIGGA